jgi:hypothetical protein
LINIAPVPEGHTAEPGDHVDQSAVLEHIIATTLDDPARVDSFVKLPVLELKLSALKRYYETSDPRVVNLLSDRHKITIDDQYKLEFGQQQILLDPAKTMIDYQLIVASSIGFDVLLPNAAGDHHFGFNMNLKRPTKQFKGKHAMVGFDTKGRMLYLGRANNDDVYLAMAPNDFLVGHIQPRPAGYSTGSSTMSRRHYRQMIMMFAHFLSEIPELAYMYILDRYGQNLEDQSPQWSYVTNIMYVHISASDPIPPPPILFLSGTTHTSL